jgi:hypothetical protein
MDKIFHQYYVCSKIWFILWTLKVTHLNRNYDFLLIILIIRQYKGNGRIRDRVVIWGEETSIIRVFIPPGINSIGETTNQQKFRPVHTDLIVFVSVVEVSLYPETYTPALCVLIIGICLMMP